ncbi:helix-turn-helix transcriptional regulator [Aliiroseovarius lamellibrachiae]|uniref:helix-turn-helix transcriptional regulator n=1 Tax=Aliiroseovarius lamellibrachiae TaxID=1924933 RepID=UPI001BE07429|nr:helix-turn-helix transcriptional regulator [Aliiroseovarius lamellibrachiae]MBT2132250.1 helix-turn-helix transcriptional regulator [Aliiroseovarius lamellibrachiae]
MISDPNNCISELKATLELATTDAQQWDAACDIVVELFGATGALLPSSNPHFRGIWVSGTKNMKAAMAEYVSDRWNLKDPREGLTQMMFDQGYATDDQIFPDREARSKLPFYRDFLLPLNFGNVCLIRILTPNGYWPLTLHFGNDHPPLSAQDIELIKTIQPMFEHAAKRAAEVAHQRIFDFAQFFRGTDSEVLLFDADGNQCFSVDAAGRTQPNRKLATLMPQEIGESLKTEFKDVLTSDPGMSLSKAYQFQEGTKSINVLVIQIPPTLRHFFMQFKACAIRTECSATLAIKQRELRETYGLSEKEISTVALLAEGKTPDMIANLLSVKPASVRQRLKLVFQKTQVSSQIELVALYGRL